jgi:thioredoxin reductase (NADPH)
MLEEVIGADDVEQVRVRDLRDKAETTLDADAVLLAIGFTASLGPILEWNLNTERKRRIRVDSTMTTNLPGVFAAGDVVMYPGKLDLIATGVSEAAVAVNHAKRHIDPTAKVEPGHSSDMDTSVKNVKVEG